MVESLKSLREPAAFVVLGALMLRLAMALVGWMLAVQGGSPLEIAARDALGAAAEPWTVVVLLVFVVACMLPDRTLRVRPLLGLGLAVVAVQIVLTVVLAVAIAVVHGAEALPVLGALAADLAILLVVTGGLVRLRRSLGSELAAVPYGSVESRASASGELESAPAERAEADKPDTSDAESRAQQPTWQPDHAAGAAWTTAGEAASGAAASGWGTAGEGTGWAPIPGRSQPDPQHREAQPDPADQHPTTEGQPRSSRHA
ncbi:MAG TPA: hypothetical protein VFP89_03155 [Propionibacteriaceae bacterium]|nr:hypothetical protein [Propionibacteriaceae bacterium]